MPLVSIIMNCHNCSKYLPEALDSVYQQTFKNYEIIFWDNQSTDNSAEIALNYGEPLQYFRGDEFIPLGEARNKAIEKSRGEYIAFLDCDDIWLPEKLEKQVELLDSNRELGLVYSDSYFINQNGELRKNTHFNGQKPSRGNVFNELFLSNFIPLLTVMIRKEVFNRVGVFNPEYEIAEEYDLWLRIAEYYPIDYIEQPLAKYRFHDQSTTIRNREQAFNESFQIIEYWLNKKPSLERELRGGIKQKKAMLHLSLMRYRLTCHNNRKAIGEIVHLIRLLPHSLILILKAITKLGNLLFHRY